MDCFVRDMLEMMHLQARSDFISAATSLWAAIGTPQWEAALEEYKLSGADVRGTEIRFNRHRATHGCVAGAIGSVTPPEAKPLSWRHSMRG
jgi:hypothetical protein